MIPVQANRIIPGEWGTSRAHELNEMSRILEKALTVELATIPSKDKQLDCPPQGIKAARETARFACQPCQIMPEFGVHTFHSVGLAFVGHRRMNARCVDSAAVEWK